MKNVLFAAGLCFVVTELSGLIISIIPIHSFLRSSSFIRTFLVVVFVTGIPTVMFALATSVMTRWLHIKKKAGILGYLLSTAIISALYLAIFPRLLYFQVPQIPDYRLMTGKHYFLWVSAIIAAMIGTWVTNNYWRGIFAQQRLSADA